MENSKTIIGKALDEGGNNPIPYEVQIIQLLQKIEENTRVA